MSDTSSYPNLNPGASANGGASTSGSSGYPAVNAVQNSASNTVNSIKNSDAMQSIANGPVAEKARVEANATSNEFSNLANSRQVPDATTATGQNLTHYHSMFYELLSWNNPRATAISFATTVTLIFITRYMPLTRYLLKVVWMVLGLIAAAELGGQLVLSQGVVSKMRPKQYFTINKENLEVVMDDLEQLINFFVIEVQRIIFAENVWKTIAAFTTAFITYFLVKVMPTWGLVLLGTCVVYLAPLIYVQNKEFIDHHLNNAGAIIGEQTKQVRDVAAQHTNKALEATKSSVGTYASKAQELVGQAKRQAVDKNIISKETAEKAPGPSVDAVSGATAMDGSSDIKAPTSSLNGSATAPTMDGSSDVKSTSFPLAPNGTTGSSSDVKDPNFPAAPKQDLPVVGQESTNPATEPLQSYEQWKTTSA